MWAAEDDEDGALRSVVLVAFEGKRRSLPPVLRFIESPLLKRIYVWPFADYVSYVVVTASFRPPPPVRCASGTVSLSPGPTMPSLRLHSFGQGLKVHSSPFAVCLLIRRTGLAY